MAVPFGKIWAFEMLPNLARELGPQKHLIVFHV